MILSLSYLTSQHSYKRERSQNKTLSYFTPNSTVHTVPKLRFQLLHSAISDSPTQITPFSHEMKKSSSNFNPIFSHNNDQTTPLKPLNSTQLPSSKSNAAAITIQSTFRSHRIRTLYRKISTVDSEADHLQNLIQLQDTVDTIRNNHIEKLKLNESLMKLLLKLDSIPGIDPTVRDARRKVTRRIVGLQEILDSVTEVKFDDECSFWNNWDDVIYEMEESVCREYGGDEIEKFCARNLGFRCLQRFLREP